MSSSPLLSFSLTFHCHFHCHHADAYADAYPHDDDCADSDSDADAHVHAHADAHADSDADSQECGRVLLGLSILLLLPSSLGYVGAVRESRLLLLAYFSPILLLWGVQLAVLILLPVIQTQLSRYST